VFTPKTGRGKTPHRALDVEDPATPGDAVAGLHRRAASLSLTATATTPHSGAVRAPRRRKRCCHCCHLHGIHVTIVKYTVERWQADAACQGHRLFRRVTVILSAHAATTQPLCTALNLECCRLCH